VKVEVLDASALLAFLLNEPGASRVEESLDRGALMSAINWAEVLSKLVDRGEDADTVVAKLQGQGVLEAALRIEPLGTTLAIHVARLRNLTRPFGLSLADRACLALAAEFDTVALTADRQWDKLDFPVKVELIR